jgi:aquaporin Z
MLDTSPRYSTSKTGLGADGWGALSDIQIGAGGAFLAEVVLTAVFVYVVLGVTSKFWNAATAGMAIGLSLTVVHLIGIPITGTSVNPARSLGPALIVGGTALSQVLLFIVAPMVGGIAAAVLHWLVFPRSAPETAATSLAAEGRLPRFQPSRWSGPLALCRTGIAGVRSG